MFDDVRQPGENGGLTVGQRISRLENIVTGIGGHESRIDDLERSRDESRGAMSLLRVVIALSSGGLVVQLLALLAGLAPHA